MERKEINQHNMHKAVWQVMENNRTIFPRNTVILNAKDQLKAFNNHIDSLMDKQTSALVGENAIKMQIEKSLIGSILMVSAAMLAHSSVASDIKLKEVASVSESGLKKLRNSDLLSFARVIAATAKPIAADLLIWNVAAADLDKLDADIVAYEEVIPVNQVSRSEAKQTTSEIKLKLSEVKAFLTDKIDPMMLTYKISSPIFYGLYEKARKGVNTAATHSGDDDAPDQNPV